MKPIKVICPICGEEMIASSWGKKRNVTEYHGLIVPHNIINYVKYECPCGCMINYVGEKDCWQECKCKSCVNFQNEVEDNDNV